jgi:deoxyadenosine/deoxycytidine kinase
MPNVPPTGTSSTKLIVIRGNSGAGKSSIARQLQRRHGRGCALVEQDHLRRVVLRERDRPDSLAPALIEQTVRFALDHQYHVVLEGILSSSTYLPLLAALRQAHRGDTFLFYLDVSWEETVRRHATRPQAAEYSPHHMREWYRPLDLLGLPDEHLVPESSSIEATITAIAVAAALPMIGREEDFMPTPTGRQ